jgi:hypothetical protein
MRLVKQLLPLVNYSIIIAIRFWALHALLEILCSEDDKKPSKEWWKVITPKWNL